MKYFAVILCLLGVASGINSSGRVIGGELATEGQFPFSVSLERKGKHSCGGSILNKRWVLTAAHCIKTHPVEEMEILAGTIKRSENGIRYKVELALMHDKHWDADNFGNDIALIKLQEDIELSSLIQPVSLSGIYVQANISVTLCGWGHVAEDGHSSDDLHFIRLKTITQDACQKRHKHTVRDYMMCTFTKVGEGSCTGDSGSPILVDGRVVGLSSWGKHCGGGYPNVYTRISHFIDWVEETMAKYA